MPEKVTPYRRWLGLAQSPPDFFQLLGLDRSENRPDLIRSAAEARLSLLKSFADPDGREERKALADEVKLAFATLSNPDKRQEYLVQTGSGRPPVLAKALPLAIPVAIPVAQTGAIPGGVAPTSTPEARPPVEWLDPLAAVAALEAKQRRRQPGRLRTWVLSILGLLLFLGGPALVVAMIYLNSAGRLTAQRPLDDRLPAGKKAEPGKSFADLIKQATEDTDQRPDARLPAESPEPAEPLANSADPPAARMEDSPTDPIAVSPPDDQRVRDIEFDSSVEFASPRVKELVRVVCNDLRYRSFSAARQRLALAAGAFTDPLESRQLLAVRQFVEHLDRYWKQLIKAGASLPTGEIKWGSEFAGFIEATDQFVLVKLKGVRLKLAWEYLPTNVAIQLAEQVAVADLPTWRLAKAAALMLDPRLALDEEPFIRQWLNQSAADGHDTVNLEWLLNRRVAREIGSEKPPPPSGPELQAAEEVLEAALPKRAIPISNLVRRKAALAEALDEAARQESPAVKYACLERARKYAIELVDIPLSRELTEALATAFEIDVEAAMLDAARQMAAYVQTEKQAEQVCETILASAGVNLTEFVKNSVEPQELRVAGELARKYRLQSMQERIAFLTDSK